MPLPEESCWPVAGSEHSGSAALSHLAFHNASPSWVPAAAAAKPAEGMSNAELLHCLVLHICWRPHLASGFSGWEVTLTSGPSPYLVISHAKAMHSMIRNPLRSLAGWFVVALPGSYSREEMHTCCTCSVFAFSDSEHTTMVHKLDNPCR